MRGEQAIFNLEIKKKSGLSINPDIHHSKVPSSSEISIWWIFMVGIDAFRVFMRTILNIEPYSLLKPTKVCFYFIGSNSFRQSWVEYWVLTSGLRNYDRDEVFKSRAFRSLR